MKLLKFRDGEELLVDLCFNGNLVTIKSPKINTSGFKVCSEDGRVVIRNASAFTTLYDSTEDEYILSCDGTVKPEPKPYEPTETEIVIDGTSYDVYDFNGKSFLTKLSPEEARQTFSEVTTIVQNDSVYRNLVFVDCYETVISDVTYTQVVFYQKDRVDLLEDKVDSMDYYQESKMAYIGDTSCEFVSDRLGMVTCTVTTESGKDILCSYERIGYKVTVNFVPLEEVATVTVNVR